MTDILTPIELAKRWGLAPGTLSNMRSKGKGPAYFKVGEGLTSKVRYRLEDVIQYERDKAKGSV